MGIECRSRARKRCSNHRTRLQKASSRRHKQEPHRGPAMFSAAHTARPENSLRSVRSIKFRRLSFVCDGCHNGEGIHDLTAEIRPSERPGLGLQIYLLRLLALPLRDLRGLFSQCSANRLGKMCNRPFLLRSRGGFLDVFSRGVSLLRARHGTSKSTPIDAPAKAWVGVHHVAARSLKRRRLRSSTPT